MAGNWNSVVVAVCGEVSIASALLFAGLLCLINAIAFKWHPLRAALVKLVLYVVIVVAANSAATVIQSVLTSVLGQTQSASIIVGCMGTVVLLYSAIDAQVAAQLSRRQLLGSGIFLLLAGLSIIGGLVVYTVM